MACHNRHPYSKVGVNTEKRGKGELAEIVKPSNHAREEESHRKPKHTCRKHITERNIAFFMDEEILPPESPGQEMDRC